MKFIQSMINRKQIYLLILILSGTLSGCVSTRSVLSPPAVSAINPLKQLQNNINSILSDPIFIPVHASIKVVSLDNEKVLYEHDSKALMNPASNVKLITSAAALSVLDTSYQFQTIVFINDITANGDVVSDIYLKGYGDPCLTTSDLDSLAFAVSRFGIKKIAGNIIVDDSFFDDDYWGAGWSWDDESDPDAPYINALSVNNNCVRINITTGLNSTSVSLEPNTGYVTVLNKTKTVSDSILMPLKIRQLSINNTKTILIEGDIFNYSQIRRRIPIHNPEFYAGTLFKESLRRAGVFVSGDIVKGVVPSGSRKVAAHFQPIEKIIQNMNKQSDNLSAENTLKVIGALKTGVPGSVKNGVSIEMRFLSDLGMDTTKFSIVDGSGTSRYNLLSADQIVQFLIAMNKQPHLFSMFYNSLPVAGIDGTLADRMDNYPAASNLRAKTGTLKGASCLSGYVQTRDGEKLAFSIMMQNFISSAYDYRQAQDKICALLAGFSRSIITQRNSAK